MGDIQKLDEMYYKNDEIISSYNYVKKYSNSDFLWAFQSGILAYQMGDFEESINYFNISEQFFENISGETAINSTFKTLATILVSNNIFEYSGKYYEAVFINYYKALSAIFINDYKSARVEFNRANDRQRRSADYFSSYINQAKQSIEKNNADFQNEISGIDSNEISKGMNSILLKNYTNISSFRAYDGYINPLIPYVSGIFFLTQNDFNKANDLLRQSYSISKKEEILKDLEILSKRKNGDKANYTWILIEDGRSPKKYEFRIDFPLFLFSKNMIYLNIALPNLDSGEEFYKNYYLKGDIEYNGFEISSLQMIVENEFSIELPYMITTSLISSSYKAYLQYLLSEKIGILGLIGGALFSKITTNADIRSSRILPLKFIAFRIKNSKNNFYIYANNKIIYNFIINNDCKDLCLNSDNMIYIRVFTNKVISLIHHFK